MSDREKETEEIIKRLDEKLATLPPPPPKRTSLKKITIIFFDTITRCREKGFIWKDIADMMVEAIDDPEKTQAIKAPGLMAAYNDICRERELAEVAESAPVRYELPPAYWVAFPRRRRGVCLKCAVQR